MWCAVDYFIVSTNTINEYKIINIMYYSLGYLIAHRQTINYCVCVVNMGVDFLFIYSYWLFWRKYSIILLQFLSFYRSFWLPTSVFSTAHFIYLILIHYGPRTLCQILGVTYNNQVQTKSVMVLLLTSNYRIRVYWFGPFSAHKICRI